MDSAYQSQVHTDWLLERGIENRLIKRRAYRNHPFSKVEKRFNQTHAGVRSTVERVFGVLKLHYAMGKARYIGLGPNRTRVELKCVLLIILSEVYHLDRSSTLKKEDLWVKTH